MDISGVSPPCQKALEDIVSEYKFWKERAQQFEHNWRSAEGRLRKSKGEDVKDSEVEQLKKELEASKKEAKWYEEQWRGTVAALNRLQMACDHRMKEAQQFWPETYKLTSENVGKKP